jgi:hypothetical protein
MYFDIKNYLKNNRNYTPNRCNFQVFVFLCSIYGMIFFYFSFQIMETVACLSLPLQLGYCLLRTTQDDDGLA